MQVPERTNIMEWLAMMRHYGAPTRLLDWTYSFFVAVYFAVECAEGDCSVWALDAQWLWQLARHKHLDIMRFVDNDEPGNDQNVTKLDTFKKVFMTRRAFVCPINAFRLNERLIIQQGTFLLPGDVSKCFETNLFSIVPRNSEGRPMFGDKLWELRITGGPTLRREILRRLHRMNMNAATLYPGLEGFALSLTRTFMAFPEILVPGRDWI
jgi:hypothetical protein